MANQEVSLPGVTNFRSELDPVVRKELDHHNAALNGFLTQEHNDDGSHGAITASSVDITSSGDFLRFHRPMSPTTVREVGAITQELVSDGPVLIIDSKGAAQIAVQIDGADVARFGVASGASGLEQQLFNATGIRGNLRFVGQGDYSMTPGDNNLLSDSSVHSPLYSYYRVTPPFSTTCTGIFSPNVAGNRGQAIVIVNMGSGSITFKHNQTATSYMRVFTPTTRDCVIGAGGSVIVVYDTSSLRWRIVSQHSGGAVAYTQAWTSSGTQPAIVNGTVTGLFQQHHDAIMCGSLQVIGSSDTFGTGDYYWSYPTTLNFPYNAVRGFAFDSSAGAYYAGESIDVDGTKFVMVSANPAGATVAWGPSVPFTWASGDKLFLNGQYFQA